MIKKITRVGIATRSIAVTSEVYKCLGLDMEAVEIVKDDQVKAAMMKVGESALVLLEATKADSSVKRFLDSHGEGIHHITLEVDDLAGHLETLKRRDVKLLSESPERDASGGQAVAIHPDSTGGVLIELMEPAGEDKK